MNWFDFFNFFSHAHSEIAENGADKVLSSKEENSSVHKAYVNFPTSRKSALDVPLYAISSGRSMVEMLGVLAIIGVLSVGAMSGYSKAMMKYKLNKQAEQVNQIINAITYIGSKQLHNDNPLEILIKLNLIPDEMIEKNSSSNYAKSFIYDTFKNKISIFYRPLPNYIEIIYYLDDNNIQTCVNLYQIIKQHSATINRISNFRGDNTCTGSNCLNKATLQNFQNSCDTILNDEQRIYIYPN